MLHKKLVQIEEKVDKILDIILGHNLIPKDEDQENPYSEVADCGKEVPESGDIDYED